MLLIDPSDNSQIVATLQKGAVGVLPTDTVYGLVCRAADKVAVARLYQLKSRDSKPGTVIAADIEQLMELGIPPRYLKPLAHLWPNPLSIVVPSVPSLQYLDLGQMSLAVRIPSDEKLQTLLKKTGPLLTTSANHPGQSTADTIAKAKDYFGDQVDFYVDGGDLSDRPASTIIKIIDDEVVVLREGVIAFNEKGEITT
jgi:L-threonylcarbamoyladenylate synthase